MASAPAPDFAALFRPRSIAIVGASDDRKRIGGQLVQNLIAAGFKGEIYPVNPRYLQIQGLTCYADLKDVPVLCDLVLIAVSADMVAGVIDRCNALGVGFAIVMSAGFREIGPEGAVLEASLNANVGPGRVRILGPNCLGVMNLRDRVYCGFGEGFRNYGLQPGPVAFVSQSGGFAFSVVSLADHEGVRFNYIASTGNEADVSTLDLVADFLERGEVSLIVIYMEGVSDGGRLRQLGRRALELSKPIVIWKGGTSATGQAAAESHTASMTASYRLYRTAFAEGGFIEVTDVHELIDVTRAHLAGRLPGGLNTAVITTSGGSGVLIADACDRYGLKLPSLQADTVALIEKLAPKNSVFSNPVDLTAQLGGDSKTLNAITELVLSDPGIDQVILRYNAVQGAGSEQWAEGLAEVVQRVRKPVFVAWSRVPDPAAVSMSIIEKNGIAWALTPARTAFAAGALARFARKRADYLAAKGRETRVIAPQVLPLRAGTGALSEHESKQCLAVYGIASAAERLLSLGEVEALTASPLNFPLAVKIDSPDIAHKTEINAVRLQIGSLAQLKEAAREVWSAAATARPDARLNGVLVAEMAQGTEIIAGVINDAYFGPVVMFGLGGIFTEVLQDVTYRFAPFDTDTARSMIGEIASAKLLQGYRGRPALAVDALADMLVRLSCLAADHADRIVEIDLNPVFVDTQRVLVADALVVMRSAAVEPH